MDIIISNSKGEPIYEQICSQIKQLIIKGKLKEGDMLPSIRLLAKELRISVITTKRAYDELERDGFIVSVAGKGSFIAGSNIELIQQEHIKDIEKILSDAVKKAKLCNVSLEELKSVLELIYEEEKNEQCN